MYGSKSANWCMSTEMYAVPASNEEALIQRIVAHLARPLMFAVTLVHVFPASFVTCTNPSLLPVHNIPGFTGDSAKAYRVQPSKVKRLSEAMPPEFCWWLLSLVV